jgi:hypothetical protein
LIKDYELEVHYHPKKANVVADALSRKAHCNYLLDVCLIGEESSTRVLPNLSLFNITLMPVWRDAVEELDALRSLVVRAQDLVLGDINVSSLLASMSVVALRLESLIDPTAANGVCWGSRSALVAIESHFSEVIADREVLGSGCNAGLTMDEVDALWYWVRMAMDSLASHIPSSVASNPPNSIGE